MYKFIPRGFIWNADSSPVGGAWASAFLTSYHVGWVQLKQGLEQFTVFAISLPLSQLHLLLNSEVLLETVAVQSVPLVLALASGTALR